MSQSHDDAMLATTVMQELLAGNKRFANGESKHEGVGVLRRNELLTSQQPHALVLSCADSRVAPELIFDAGLGDIFSVRSAGAILDEAVIASLEYAVQDLPICLLMVLSHEHCGAIATVGKQVQTLVQNGDEGEILEACKSSSSMFMRALAPAVLSAMDDGFSAEDAERIHVAQVLSDLIERSVIIREAVCEGRVMLIGARYRMSDGLVEILSC